MNQLGTYYNQYLLNRVSATQTLVEYIENCLITENEVSEHSYHKITVYRWTESEVKLFEVLSEYFVVTFVPVQFETQNVVSTFYTSSLSFVLKIIKLDFMFPHARTMHNMDILFNDKTSHNLFKQRITIDNIVTSVVSSRFNEMFELNLSYFCNDPKFVEMKIFFYHLTLLSHFKILMIRMGRDTRILNLSNNNLSQVPLNILNFFIKGQLIGINLSNNNIPSLTELQRISSKIEKLWVEGNPLCEGLDSITYIKQIVQKFPRLTELDGIKLNNYGVMMPFYKNYLAVPDKRTKMLVEKFVSLYFSHYDSSRRKIDLFYDPMAQMMLSTSFLESEENTVYAAHSRNMLNPEKRQSILNNKRWYAKRAAILSVLTQLPKSSHDITSFSIDVLQHDHKCLILIIDGVFKEEATKETPERILQFRRTFIFHVHSVHTMSFYNIVHEMFSVSLASPEIVKNSFKHPVRNLNQLTLINPEQEEKDVICTAFMYYTQLKRAEAEARLLSHDWDLRVALKAFATDCKNDMIHPDKFENAQLLVDEID
ncbi:nuclear RNA export factor 1-like [Vanessa atalanta]|uniref:nuclear RNA export factor 1-like n=1 Tax=Vanessa atalanta TaxID=42275 RepID=UPI001FCCED69|nr:nuclear RNA export factor 1-like [Vanessa atalanta]